MPLEWTWKGIGLSTWFVICVAKPSVNGLVTKALCGGGIAWSVVGAGGKGWGGKTNAPFVYLSAKNMQVNGILKTLQNGGNLEIKVNFVELPPTPVPVGFI